MADENITGIEKKDEFGELMDLLCGFMKLMSDADTRKNAAREKLVDEKKMMQINRKFRELAKFARILGIIRHDSQSFILNRESYAKDIEVVDKKGAKIIRELKVPDNRELPVITAVLGWINRIVKFETKLTAEQKRAGVEKLKSYVAQLEAEPFKDKESAEALKKITHIIEGAEVQWLGSFIEDVRRWKEWRMWGGGQTIEFFINRAKQYLSGGEGMKGLQKDFGDNKITAEMEENSAVKNLRTFKKQIELFDNIFNYLKQIVETRTWTAKFRKLDGKEEELPFLGRGGFYYNLSHGENYIGTVEKKFGNKEFAHVLKEFEKKTHQQPGKWEEEFRKLEGVLKSRNYENDHVIMPAAMELEQIFMRRIEELRKEKDAEIEKHKKVLDKKLKDIEHAGQIASKDFRKVVKKKKNEVYRRWNKAKRVFSSVENNIMNRSVGFTREIEEIEPWLRYRDAYVYIKKQNEIKYGLTKFLNDTLPKLKVGDEYKAIAPYMGALYFMGGAVQDKENEIVNVLKQMEPNPSLIMKLKVLVAEARLIYRRYELLLKLIDKYEENYAEEGKTPKNLEVAETAAVAQPTAAPETAARSAG